MGAIICHRSSHETPPVYTEEQKAVIKANQFNAKQLIMDYVSFFKIKVFRRLVMFSLIFTTGYIMMNDGAVYTMISYLGLSEARQSLFWTINTVLSLIAIPIVFGIANKWDKRRAMILFVATYVASSLLWFVLGLAQTLGAALASLLLGWGLQIIGYTDAATASEFAKDGIWFMGTAGPAILVLISMFFLVRYNLTRKDFEDVRQAIKDREEGKEIDMSKFDYLI